MNIKQTHALQSLVSIPLQPAKNTGKASEAGSFASLMSSHATAPALPYRPAGTAQAASAGTAPASTTPASPLAPSTPALFTAGFLQGVVTGPDGSATSLNSAELSDPKTAQEVAALLGGTVTQDSMAGGYTATAAAAEITIPGSSVEINAGLAANMFATYGTQQGSQAWLTINQDLGRSPMSTGPVS